MSLSTGVIHGAREGRIACYTDFPPDIHFYVNFVFGEIICRAYSVGGNN